MSGLNYLIIACQAWFLLMGQGKACHQTTQTNKKNEEIYTLSWRVSEEIYTLSCLNVKELLAHNRCNIWSLFSLLSLKTKKNKKNIKHKTKQKKPRCKTLALNEGHQGFEFFAILLRNDLTDCPYLSNLTFFFQIFLSIPLENIKCFI